mmetsp:Transcript_22806/g.35714  ORF Transcript_22806/g.35714 Transcript_22806/m.35714 type:complete len:289 (+) Transcript_22806:101-967(+)
MKGVNRWIWGLETPYSNFSTESEFQTIVQQSGYWSSGVAAFPNRTACLLRCLSAENESRPWSLFLTEEKKALAVGIRSCVSDRGSVQPSSVCVPGGLDKPSSVDRLSGGTEDGNPLDFDSQAKPLRFPPGKCDFYMRYGECRLGTMCQFQHEGRPDRRAVKRAISFVLLQAGYILGKKRKKAIEESGWGLLDGWNLGPLSAGAGSTKKGERFHPKRDSGVSVGNRISFPEEQTRPHEEDSISTESDSWAPGPSFRWVFEALVTQYEGWYLTRPRIERLTREVLNCDHS